MKAKIYWLVVIFGLAGLMVSCAPKEKAEEHEHGMEMEQPAKEEKEKVKCAYDGMEMYKKAFEASMEYEGKTLYFCTNEEMEKFKEDPQAYLSGEKKGKMGM